jgi:hypothetical protein
LLKQGTFLRPFCFHMRITDKLAMPCKKIEPLYFVEIQEDSTIAYITKPKHNHYIITTEYRYSWLFDNQDTIRNLDILKGINYNLINFNDIFVPAYIIRLTDSGQIAQNTRWTNIGIQDINRSNYLATTNIHTAKEKLEYLKYNKIHELQKQICDICELEIYVPPVGN